MEKTIAMWIAYDGADYCGWQKQKHHKTIQGILEKKLARILKTDIRIHGSGRTDSGVHAMGQCVTFTADLIMPVDRIQVALNKILPSDIFINDVREMPNDFHARYSAIGKTYVYKVYMGKQRDPFKDRYYSYCPYKLDLEAIKNAIPCFLGQHDFRTFMASGSQVSNTVRTIHVFELKEDFKNNILEFTISGDGFLYNMVRIIIGTLFQVGRGNVKVEEIPNIIEACDRSAAKWTAPAQGLYLKEVHYENNVDS
ncbi:tRNA pseudouridine(38-40) synthase TruA [Fusibacter tunisiensis]|uniref:tRNA pseudouridine synthase A n=1 Tax=Fusibacter tunisiensis TaxID=1008308 RepID=A0ABS2MR09_9FIRM|nr:tRNA pseudouridine(38-40) synthase TruA [Fusibacter tunisiensis]MBM7561829.1 tRNA pseudouridine38-40 synthase [Fusibacter tunisiensis]